MSQRKAEARVLSRAKKPIDNRASANTIMLGLLDNKKKTRRSKKGKIRRKNILKELLTA